MCKRGSALSQVRIFHYLTTCPLDKNYEQFELHLQPGTFIHQYKQVYKTKYDGIDKDDVNIRNGLDKLKEAA